MPGQGVGDDAAGPAPGAALPEPGSVLLAAWRGDPAMFRRSLQGRTAVQLLGLIDAVLHRADRPAPPLVAAARQAASRAPDPAALLRGVLSRIVDDLAVDLADPALATPPPNLQTGPAAERGRPPAAGAAPVAGPGPAMQDRRPAWEARRQPEAVPDGGLEPSGLAELAARLVAHGDVAGRVAGFVATSDPAERARLLEHLRPGFAEREQVALAILWDALPETLSRGDPQRNAMWRLALLIALGRARHGGGLAGLAMAAVAHLAADAMAARDLARHLLERIEGARPRRAPAAAAQLASGLRLLLGWPAAAAGSVGSAAAADSLQTTRTAGLALVAVYLPMLFDRLEITVRGGFPDPEAAERAMDVLQAITHGERPVPRGLRPLERLLCAIPPDRPLRPRRALAAPEAALVDDLLRTLIRRWSALGSTSVEGLREAFLQRDGLLRPTGDGIALEVSSRAYDMLIDRLPWSMTVTKLAWMPAPIHVIWRK